MTDSLVVDRRQLRLGPLLAEGGEGRVYELPDWPDRVYKAYRSPGPRPGLADFVGWSATLEPAAARRVGASAAWPVAMVTDGPLVPGAGKGEPGPATGLVLPRAPRRFSLRHRDGRSHLATLSYLTADPDRRSAAYGIDLPPVMSPERLGLVYVLARLIEAFESGSPAFSHGDLSAKNVLWSLSRGPEVFIIDCDNGERYASGAPRSGPDGYSEPRALGPADRRRAMTPNWDDPAVRTGTNPGPYADRYSLALIFLRVCGAAHYPIQKRQKAGEPVDVEIGVPAAARRVRSLGPSAPLWQLCSAGLGHDPASRPPAATWVAALEAVIADLGAARILDAVWASQGRAPLRAGASVDVAGAAAAGASSVGVHPVPFRPRVDSHPSRIAVPAGGSAPRAAGGAGWTLVRTPAGGVTTNRAGVPPTGWAVGPGGQTGVGVRAQPSGPSIGAQAKAALVAVVAWLVGEHRTTIRYLRNADQRSRGLWRIPWCAAIDFVAACVVLFLVAMIAAPFLGV